MPVRCAPTYSTEINYQWQIYTHLNESFKKAIDDNKIGYLESLKDDKNSLLLYFTRIVECDGWIEMLTPSNDKTPYKKRINTYVGFAQKDYQYVHRLAKIISEVFKVPVSVRYNKRKHLTKLYLPTTDTRVRDLLRKMPMVHPERNLKRELALKYTGEEATDDLLREINSAREAIRRLRDLTVELAEERYRLEKRKRVMTADELVEEVLKRYAERFNDHDVERYFRI